MSNNQQNHSSEEVDLGQLFNAIGNLFQRFFNFIGSIFKALFSVFIFLLKALITYFKIIAAVLILAFVIGFALERTKAPTYQSKMLVEPYFDTQFILVDNVNYYNSLIINKDLKSIVQIFEISEEEASGLVQFHIEAGPESDTDKLKQYDEFLRTIDTSRADEITYTEFLENRDIYAAQIFEITCRSTNKSGFSKLEKGITKIFDNNFSKRQISKRDQAVAIEKSSIEETLKSIDSTRSAYIRALDQKSNTSTISLGERLRVDSGEETSREIELIDKEIELRNRIRSLDQRMVETDKIFEVVSGFPNIGTRVSGLSTNYKFLFPMVAFIILSILFFGIMIIRFVKTYEAK